MIQRQKREEIVRLCGYRNSLHRGKNIEHDSKAQKQQVGENKCEAEPENILLGIFLVFAGQTLLHHILIQTIHHDDDSQTGNKLFEKIGFRAPVPVEYFAVRMFINGFNHLTKIHVELGRYENDS